MEYVCIYRHEIHDICLQVLIIAFNALILFKIFIFSRHITIQLTLLFTAISFQLNDVFKFFTTVYLSIGTVTIHSDAIVPSTLSKQFVLLELNNIVPKDQSHNNILLVTKFFYSNRYTYNIIQKNC